jgi:HipA-like protein
MRALNVFRNGVLAGTLTEVDRQQFVFRYEDRYWLDPSHPAISLTLPKSRKEHRSDVLFPFFANMVSEGVNLRLQSLQWNIDEEDLFGMLGATARWDTIGAVTLTPIETA